MHAAREAFVSHRNAGTAFHGRLLIIDRHRARWPQPNIAKATWISRRCKAKWIARFTAEEEAGPPVGRPATAVMSAPDQLTCRALDRAAAREVGGPGD